MTEKRVTVILYGSDRNLWSGGPLQIRVADLFAAGGPKVLSQGKTEASTVELRLELPFDAGQVYGLTFSAPRHRPAWQLVRRLDFIRTPEKVEGDDLILRLMLVPDSPGTTDLAEGLERLKQIASPFAAPGTGTRCRQGSSRSTSAAKMAFLNIEAKLRETVIDGAPLMSFVRGVRHVAVDRVFLLFDSGLKARMPRAIDFAGAPGHGAPKALPDLPAHPDSWKHTRFAEGNVQLSFLRGRDAVAGRRRRVAGAFGRCRHRSRSRTRARAGMAREQRLPAGPQDQPGAGVRACSYAQGILPQYTLDPAPATTRQRRAQAQVACPCRSKAPPRRTRKRNLAYLAAFRQAPGTRGRSGGRSRGRSRGR